MWAVETLIAKGWLSKVPRLDTATGIVPWNSKAALAMLRARQDFSVDTLLRMRRSPYVVRSNPDIVGRPYATVGPNVPIVQAFDRRGKLVAYGTKSQHWVFVALPTDLVGGDDRAKSKGRKSAVSPHRK